MSTVGMTLTNGETIRELEKIRRRIGDAIGAVGRKTSWRDLEKAMAVASYRRELVAISNAIEALQKENRP